jgi:hypothetical protein
MHIGLMMECDYREGQTQEEAFDDAFATAADAETWGFDGIWLAERHFAPPGSGRAIPSVVASPLIFATAIAARVVFQKWRWPCLHCPSKGIAVDKQANDDIVHLCRFRKADGLADQAFNARS